MEDVKQSRGGSQESSVATGSHPASNGRAKRVLLIDEHPLVRDGISVLLSRDTRLTVTGWASDPHQAVGLLQRHAPDLVIMEIALNGSNGIELIKRLAAQNSRLAILVLSQHDEDLYAERAFRAGAKGFISKKEEPKVILSAVQTVLEGKHYFSPRVSSRLWDKVWSQSSEKETNSVESLTDRELQVLELIGKGQRTSAIAELLGISMKTVETYRSKLKQKFDLQDGAQLTRFAVEWVNNRTQ